MCIHTLQNGHKNTPGWFLCRINPIDLISPSVPLMAHAPVHVCLLF